jgi:cell wall assembly regulator SMI1
MEKVGLEPAQAVWLPGLGTDNTGNGISRDMAAEAMHSNHSMQIIIFRKSLRYNREAIGVKFFIRTELF